MSKKFAVGDKIITIQLDDTSTLHEYTVTKVGKDTVQCGSSEQTFYTAFCWPARVKEQLLEVVRERERLKKVYDDSMKLVYELGNKIERGEI